MSITLKYFFFFLKKKGEQFPTWFYKTLEHIVKIYSWK